MNIYLKYLIESIFKHSFGLNFNRKGTYSNIFALTNYRRANNLNIVAPSKIVAIQVDNQFVVVDRIQKNVGPFLEVRVAVWGLVTWQEWHVNKSNAAVFESDDLELSGGETEFLRIDEKHDCRVGWHVAEAWSRTDLHQMLLHAHRHLLIPVQVEPVDACVESELNSLKNGYQDNTTVETWALRMMWRWCSAHRKPWKLW